MNKIDKFLLDDNNFYLLLTGIILWFIINVFIIL